MNQTLELPDKKTWVARQAAPFKRAKSNSKTDIDAAIALYKKKKIAFGLQFDKLTTAFAASAYDDTPISARIKALEEALGYDDALITARIENLEVGVYDDTPLVARITALESKPTFDATAILADITDANTAIAALEARITALEPPVV